MRVNVLRLRHRLMRDDRATTHLFLVARAFGASKVVYSGRRDEDLEREIDRVTKTWGGRFEVQYVGDWEKTMKDWKEEKGEIVHLTMYGLPLQDSIGEIREAPGDKLVVVGGAKVPGRVYGLADWNVAVTSQPHSEISALSVFLHELFQGTELMLEFEGARLRVMPQARGKKVVSVENSRLGGERP